MKRSLPVNGVTFLYTLKRPILSRKLRILIKPSGDVVVTAPRSVTLAKIEHFLKEQAAWIIEKVNFAKEKNKQLKDLKVQTSFSANSARARKLAHERARYFAGVYGVSYNKISIKNQSTQWGSCSSKKNLNFNYRIVFLPPDLVDYIVVHEICHLIEMNHSERFWKQVARIVPNYRTQMLKLKKIHLFQ